MLCKDRRHSCLQYLRVCLVPVENLVHFTIAEHGDVLHFCLLRCLLEARDDVLEMAEHSLHATLQDYSLIESGFDMDVLLIHTALPHQRISVEFIQGQHHFFRPKKLVGLDIKSLRHGLHNEKILELHCCRGVCVDVGDVLQTEVLKRHHFCCLALLYLQESAYSNLSCRNAHAHGNCGDCGADHLCDPVYRTTAA